MFAIGIRSDVAGTHVQTHTLPCLQQQHNTGVAVLAAVLGVSFHSVHLEAHGAGEGLCDASGL